MDNGSKLYLDVPRYLRDNLEIFQTDSLIGRAKDKGNLLSTYAKRAKDFIKGDSDDIESGEVNWSKEYNLGKLDIYDNDTTDVPISGLYDIES